MTAHLPIHPRTGLAALAVVGGRPVWPILGGSEPAPEATPAAPPGVATAVTGPAPGAPAPIGTPAAGEVEGPRAGEDPGAFLARVGPEAAAKLALQYRNEAGDRRVAQRTAEQTAEQQKTAAAEEARAALIEQLRPTLVALGVVKGDETPDPAKLTTDLQAARAESEQQQLAARTLTIENAVLRQTVALGVDGDRLLDSRKFADTVAKLDPTDDAFGGSIKAAIEAAVKSDASLKTARVVAAAGMSHVGGSGGQAGQVKAVPLADAVAAAMNPTR